jgi:hypothetical protein
MLSGEVFATCVCMYAYCVFLFFPAIDSNDECAEVGEVLEYQEEGSQGQANQGKPSLDAYLNPIDILCIASYYSLIYALISLYCYWSLDDNS